MKKMTEAEREAFGLLGRVIVSLFGVFTGMMVAIVAAFSGHWIVVELAVLVVLAAIAYPVFGAR